MKILKIKEKSRGKPMYLQELNSYLEAVKIISEMSKTPEEVTKAIDRIQEALKPKKKSEQTQPERSEQIPN